MKTAKKRRAHMEARPVASRSEVQTAVLQGHLNGLLQKKRVKLDVAVEVLDAVRLFLANTTDQIEAKKIVPDDDPRIEQLVKFITKLKMQLRPASSMLRETKTVGQTLRYKVQRNGQRRGFISLSLSTIEIGEEFSHVDVFFKDEDTIIVKRASREKVQV